jgi:hypothetical protein
VPRYDLVFLATSDEENGSHLGTEWLAANRPDIFSGVRYALTEGGLTEVVGDRVQHYYIDIGSRQFVDVKARSTSREELRRMRIALEPYFNPRDPQRILPEVRNQFSRVASTRPVNGVLLENIDATIANGKFWLLDPSYRQLTQNTIGVTGIKRAGDGWECSIVLSNLPDVDPKSAFAALQRIVAPYKVELEVVTWMGPMRLSSTDSPFFQLIASKTASWFDGQVADPHIDPSSTNDCRFIRNMGIDCFGAPHFRVNWFQSKGIHGPNEGVRLDWFVDGVEFTRDVVFSYLFPGDK